MSENKKPENLLAEILYSRKRVHASYYKDGKFTHGDEHASILGEGLSSDSIRDIVLDAVGRLLKAHTCGIVIEPGRCWQDDTVLWVFDLTAKSDVHLWHVSKPKPGLLPSDSVNRWLVNHLKMIPVFYTKNEVEARTGITGLEVKPIKIPHSAFSEWLRGPLAGTWVPEAWEPKMSVASTRDKLHLFKNRGEDRPHPTLVVREDTARKSADHIPALRGLFALARANYALVTADELQAAVDAGYMHPDVLAAVADEIAYAMATDELIAGLEKQSA